MNVTKALITARGFLNTPDDYARGTRDNGKGGHCVLGLLDLAFGFDPSNHKAPCLQPRTYQDTILALAVMVPEEFKREGLARWAKTELPDGGDVIQPMATAVALYNNALDFDGVCKWLDQTIKVRKLIAV